MREDVGIITMGPQDTPFDDPEKFGVDFTVGQTCGSQRAKTTAWSAHRSPKPAFPLLGVGPRSSGEKNTFG